MIPKRKIYIQNCTGDDCEKKNSRGIFSRFLFLILLCGFIGVSIYVLIFSPYLEVTEIKIIGTQELSVDDLRQAVSSLEKGAYLKYIPKDNYLIISQKNIENLLKDNFKKIRSVSIVKKFPNKIEISIEERKALMVWCSGEKCFLVDEKGVAYGEADFSSQEISQNNLIKITDVSGYGVGVGDLIMNESLMQYVISIKDMLKAHGLEASGDYSMPSRVADEVDVKTVQGSEIYFSTQFSLDSASKILAAVFKKEITDNQKKDLAYMDLRTENKVFYKLNSSKPVEQQASSGENSKQSEDSKEEKKKN